MKKLLCATLVATGFATAAAASPISVQFFSGASAIGDLNAAFPMAGPGVVIEDFEDSSNFTGNFEDNVALSTATATNKEGEIDSVLGGTAVGWFETLGGMGSGTTCGRLDINGDGCDNIALQQLAPVNGQGNIVPETGEWAINTADTIGLSWVVETGFLFDQVVFALRDPGDQGTKTLRISDGLGNTITQADITDTLVNENFLLVQIDFASQLTQAFIEIETSRNDAFTFDGAAVNVVPLPAGIWMLLAGVGGLAALKRRRAAA